MQHKTQSDEIFQETNAVNISNCTQAAREHEVSTATFAAEDAEKEPLIMNTLPRSNRQRREPSSKRIFPKRDAASKKQAALREAIAAEEQRKLEVKMLEIHVEEGKAAEIKNNVQTVKNSLEAHQHQVERMWLRWN